MRQLTILFALISITGAIALAAVYYSQETPGNISELEYSLSQKLMHYSLGNIEET